MIEQKLNGVLFKEMVIQASLAMNEKKERANELNVFPVPDGDTGTNMSMTMCSAAKELEKLENPTLEKAVSCTASALLRGARGNSGVILSLLFRGIAKRLKTLNEADGKDFALALRDGIDAAYKAVMKPAEGTILTVSRVSAQHAVERCQAQPSLSVAKVLDAVLERGKIALEETKTQNPVLAKANVVDAGGFGLLVIIEAMRDELIGIKHNYETKTNENSSADFSLISDEEITFTYCTEIIINHVNKSKNIGRLKNTLNEIGDSLVIVDDDDIIKIHVHTDKPNKVLEEGLKFGPLITIKIENMREQHTAKVIESTQPKERIIKAPERKYGFVAVCSGDGVKDLFKDLGCDVIVKGGQTMNPSTNDILYAIDATPSEIVFVFPNNKNIIMAANQAVSLSEKKVVVIPSKNIPQGICALLNFEQDLELDDNIYSMTNALNLVTVGQLTYAARNSDFDGKKIKEGEYLSICEGKLCANTKKPFDAMKKLAKEMVKFDSSFATIIYGQDITENEAEKVSEIFAKENSNMEISIINGGQPVYYYIVSVE